MLSSSVIANADSLRKNFVDAWPFRHIAIGDFFEAGFAERLLEEFPSFDRKLATTELGHVGGKAVNTEIREISPAYEELYSLISSKAFLEFMSEISGIPNLLHDPKMYGGGTHENRHGQDLDPHIDFNYGQEDGLHRRLNLIVYLNKGWKTEWGGAIEIHSNPRRVKENRIVAFDPLFNRAIMFETNEISWHGFPRIELPEEERHRSRKSISIYLYTKERPSGEVAPEHGTFYVQRPLPANIAAGYTLTEPDMHRLEEFLMRRDRWIELYQKMEMDKNRTIAELGTYIGKLRNSMKLPVTGYALQDGVATGVHDDGWIASGMKARIRPLEAIDSFSLLCYRPPDAGPGQVRVLIDGIESAKRSVATGSNDIAIDLRRAKDEIFTLEVFFEAETHWSDPGDDRDLALILTELRMSHPKKKGLFR